MLAKDIMTRDVITVRAEEEVEKVAQLLLDNKISGVPVVDENYHLVGMVTEKDLMVKATELRVPFYINYLTVLFFWKTPYVLKTISKNTLPHK
jgi:CBS-domain-containing membrane protein